MTLADRYKPTSTVRRRLLQVLWIAPALTCFAALTFGLRLWSTRPEVSGSVQVAGLGEEVAVVRDEGGVPHIYARTERDAYFGLGYVHAQDRAFQIELQRRMASGTLAELLGEPALVSDRLFRALGLRESARASLAQLEPATRDALDGYVRGYNAALAAGASAPELVALYAEPAPIDVIDCLLSFKLVAFQLSGNMLRELENYRLSRKFSYQQMAELAPAVPGDPERRWPDSGSFAFADASWLDDVARAMLQTTPSSASNATGSNAWVVTGERSETGRPLLANDPHLGLSVPAVWYLAHLQAPGLNVIGATLPGTAGVWLGRNDHVAWGITNTGSDTQDLYVEQLDSKDANRVLGPGGAVPMTQRRERISVRGGETHEFIARATRHGPVVSDADPEIQRQLIDARAGHVLALAWTGLQPDASVQFPIRAARSRDASQLLAAVRDVGSPQQNMLYADDAGAVGFQAIGRLPVRAPENTALGRLPAPGWDATYDWRGEVPFEALPASGPDGTGRVLNANDKITTGDDAPFVTSEWELPYRASRIAALLDAKPRHALSDFARMQLDVRSEVARELLPELLAQLGEPSPEHAPLVARLRGWDGSMRRDRVEPLAFHAWVERLSESLYPRDYFQIRPVADPRVLRAMLRGEGNAASYCGSERQRDCQRRVRESFSATFDGLRERYGADLAGWRWGSHNIAWFSHLVFSGLPWVGGLVDLKLGREGSSDTINLSAFSFDPESGEYVTSIGPSLRAVYDLAQPERSLFIVAPGQSGNPLSPRFRDLASRWERGAYLPMITDRAAVQRKPHATLMLKPDGGNET